MAIQRIISKWKKHTALLAHPELGSLLPETALFTRSNLDRLLSQHTCVYVKPDASSHGKGVMRVDKLTPSSASTATGASFAAAGSPDYQLHYLKKAVRYPNTTALYKAVTNTALKRRYLVQQGIELLRHEGRRFDLRVMVQHNLKGKWEVTGIIGRLSDPARIVTNYHSGGTPLAFEQLMSTHLSASEQEQLLQQLRQIGVAVGEHLSSTYPRLRELGVDIALDETFKPWILEVNTLPDPFIFRCLQDKSIFRTIYRYATAYGRFKPRQRGSGKSAGARERSGASSTTRPKRSTASSRPLRKRRHSASA